MQATGAVKQGALLAGPLLKRSDWLHLWNSRFAVLTTEALVWFRLVGGDVDHAKAIILHSGMHLAVRDGATLELLVDAAPSLEATASAGAPVAAVLCFRASTAAELRSWQRVLGNVLRGLQESTEAAYRLCRHRNRLFAPSPLLELPHVGSRNALSKRVQKTSYIAEAASASDGPAAPQATDACGNALGAHILSVQPAHGAWSEHALPPQRDCDSAACFRCIVDGELAVELGKRAATLPSCAFWSSWSSTTGGPAAALCFPARVAQDEISTSGGGAAGVAPRSEVAVSASAPARFIISITEADAQAAVWQAASADGETASRPLALAADTPHAAPDNVGPCTYGGSTHDEAHEGVCRAFRSIASALMKARVPSLLLPVHVEVLMLARRGVANADAPLDVARVTSLAHERAARSRGLLTGRERVVVTRRYLPRGSLRDLLNGVADPTLPASAKYGPAGLGAEEEAGILAEAVAAAAAAATESDARLPERVAARVAGTSSWRFTTAPSDPQTGAQRRVFPLPSTRAADVMRCVLRSAAALEANGLPASHIHAGNVLVDEHSCFVSEFELPLLGLPPHHESLARPLPHPRASSDYFIMPSVLAAGHLLYELLTGEALTTERLAAWERDGLPRAPKGSMPSATRTCGGNPTGRALSSHSGHGVGGRVATRACEHEEASSKLHESNETQGGFMERTALPDPLGERSVATAHPASPEDAWELLRQIFLPSADAMTSPTILDLLENPFLQLAPQSAQQAEREPCGHDRRAGEEPSGSLHSRAATGRNAGASALPLFPPETIEARMLQLATLAFGQPVCIPRRNTGRACSAFGTQADGLAAALAADVPSPDGSGASGVDAENHHNHNAGCSRGGAEPERDSERSRTRSDSVEPSAAHAPGNVGQRIAAEVSTQGTGRIHGRAQHRGSELDSESAPENSVPEAVATCAADICARDDSRDGASACGEHAGGKHLSCACSSCTTGEKVGEAPRSLAERHQHALAAWAAAAYGAVVHSSSSQRPSTSAPRTERLSSHLHHVKEGGPVATKPGSASGGAELADGDSTGAFGIRRPATNLPDSPVSRWVSEPGQESRVGPHEAAAYVRAGVPELLALGDSQPDLRGSHSGSWSAEVLCLDPDVSLSGSIDGCIHLAAMRDLGACALTGSPSAASFAGHVETMPRPGTQLDSSRSGGPELAASHAIGVAPAPADGPALDYAQASRTIIEAQGGPEHMPSLEGATTPHRPDVSAVAACHPKRVSTCEEPAQVCEEAHPQGPPLAETSTCASSPGTTHSSCTSPPLASSVGRSTAPMRNLFKGNEPVIHALAFAEESLQGGCRADVSPQSWVGSFPRPVLVDALPLAAELQTQLSRLPNKNRPSQYAWLGSLLGQIAAGCAPIVADDSVPTTRGVPLFVVAGACPSVLAGMQAIMFSAMRDRAGPPKPVTHPIEGFGPHAPSACGSASAAGLRFDFWWVKPRSSTSKELEPHTLHKHSYGPHKNEAGRSRAVYLPIAALWEDDVGAVASGGKLRFGVSTCRCAHCRRQVGAVDAMAPGQMASDAAIDSSLVATRAWIESVETGERYVLILVWLEDWSTPFARSKFMRGKIVYQRWEEPDKCLCCGADVDSAAELAMGADDAFGGPGRDEPSDGDQPRPQIFYARPLSIVDERISIAAGNADVEAFAHVLPPDVIKLGCSA